MLGRFFRYVAPVGSGLLAVQLLGTRFPDEPWRLVLIGVVLQVAYTTGNRE